MQNSKGLLQPPPTSLAWTIWCLAALLYLMGFFQRVAPAVITTELMDEFGLTATALGNLSAVYFYSYVAMQIPTGVLADSWGPRRLLALGGLVAGLGTLLFALAPGLGWANLGRLLIGGSVAVAFVSMLKLAMHWLAPKQYALTSGLAVLVGVIGAIVAGVPLQLMVTAYGWRPVLAVSALVFFGVGILIWRIVRDDPQERGYASFAAMDTSSQGQTFAGAARGIGQVFRYRNTWLLFLIPGGLVGPVLAFAGLWGVPFLTTHYHLPATQAAAVCTTLLVSFAISGPVLGALSDKIGRRKPLYVAGSALAAVGWCVLIFIPALPGALLVTLIAGIGLGSSSMIIGFAFIKESVSLQLAGTVSGVINTGVMLGPMLLQPGIGWMLDQRWLGEIEAGIRVYNLNAYQAGFTLMLVWSVLACILILFSHETYCRQFETSLSIRDN